jgi:magnesium chelatase subunit D
MWAYQERAAVTLVQIGAASAAHELRAQLLSVPNVLVPSLNSALNAGPGRASPLAHGLDMALQTLRRAVQSGRNAVQRVRLVVLSDGRGNVPLEASQSGELRGPVRRRGIDDALQLAPTIARMSHVQRVLLNPQPRPHADLPLRLAAALGAQKVDLRPLRPQEAPR